MDGTGTRFVLVWLSPEPDDDSLASATVEVTETEACSMILVSPSTSVLSGRLSLETSWALTTLFAASINLKVLRSILKKDEFRAFTAVSIEGYSETSRSDTKES